MATPSFSQTKSYLALKEHCNHIKNKHLREIFQENPHRDRFSVSTEHIYFDYSRQRVLSDTLPLLFQLAKERELDRKIEAMFQGEKINRTENRAVLHTALRSSSKHPIFLENENITSKIQKVLEQIQIFCKEVQEGKRKGVTEKPLKNFVAIGIGGSYLGAQYLARALRSFAQKDRKLHFIANVDGTDFYEKTEKLNPEETLFIVISKTFTTAETMQNANSAKQWMLQRLHSHPQTISRHFVAVSTNEDKVKEFGIDPKNMFVFWDWVGGRFSATSAVGALPLALYLGFDNFLQILRGAEWMDQHFRTEPWQKNIPVLSALIDIWNINFLGFTTRAVLPYSQALSFFPAYIQQGEMESNGKSVDLAGNPVTFSTGEVVFGECGTNSQHSFYQLLHQGTQIIPMDFIGFVLPQHPLGTPTEEQVTHHQELMCNFLAQPDAFAFGKQDPTPHKNFPGNRPSSIFLLKKLTPFTAGILLSWIEHRIATKGFIWGINSFDQFGVELGKKLGVELRNRILEHHRFQTISLEGLNPSTQRIFQAFLESKLPNHF